MKMHKEYIRNEGVFTDYKAQMLETVQKIVKREEHTATKLCYVLKERKESMHRENAGASVGIVVERRFM